jgi:NADP-dependent 3-hydroxy acid dehydrogenase YdfG
MSSIQGKVIIITGASSGIGEATARLLAERGAHVVVGARRTERLEQLVAEITAKGGSARFRAVDVASRKDTQALVDFAKSEFGRVDVLVNNAGVMPLSPLSALKVDEWDQMINVNIRGVLHGIVAVLPDMKARGDGQIINVASIGAHHVAPTGAVYCATKYAVWAISDGLRQENTDLRVTVISHPASSNRNWRTRSPMWARPRPWKTIAASPLHRMPSPAPSRSRSSNRATWT